PCASTTCCSARPLIALCAVSRNAPAIALVPSDVASHFTRSAPVSLVNDSVCRLPDPAHEPTERQIIWGGAFAADTSCLRQPAVAATTATAISAIEIRAFIDD